MPTYLSQSYNYNGNIIQVSEQSTIRLSVTDPFGSIWANNYGSSRDESTLSEESAFAKGDFTCLNPSKVQSGSGKITSINGNTINIEDSMKRKMKLKIGACSRI